MKQTWTEDLQEHRTTNAFAVDTAGKAVTSLAAMQFVQRKQYWNIDNLNAYLTFDFNIGAANSKTLVGYDLAYWQKALAKPKKNSKIKRAFMNRKILN